ncbi:LCP family protein [Streptomyces peucetius]|uniref:LCP family protein n=1 Tax=Streptomyces peucetius TaxID=1950 RepID=A0ABY6I635_STRPE|nr:LCP family protein [Streptomyces peucetius]UYQ62459.1 LCP family protein [Streptomyces peucetius]
MTDKAGTPSAGSAAADKNADLERPATTGPAGPAAADKSEDGTPHAVAQGPAGTAAADEVGDTADPVAQGPAGPAAADESEDGTPDAVAQGPAGAAPAPRTAGPAGTNRPRGKGRKARTGKPPPGKDDTSAGPGPERGVHAPSAEPDAHDADTDAATGAYGGSPAAEASGKGGPSAREARAVEHEGGESDGGTGSDGTGSGGGVAADRADATGPAGEGPSSGDGGTGGSAGAGAPTARVPGGGRGPDRPGSSGPGRREPGGGGPGAGSPGDTGGPRWGGPGRGGPGGTGGPGDGADRRPRRPRRWMRWAALGLSVVLLAAAGAGWWFYRKLDSNITTDINAAAELRAYEKERPVPVATDAQNILLLGSDTRAGEGNSKYGRDEGGGGSQRSDTTILLHIAADRKSATAMSIPRDLVVTIPSCGKGDGSRTKERVAQFNWAFQFGGAACTIRTVEKFTGIRIDHHMVIDFRGFKDMVDAVDGVEVCLKEPIDDKDARLKLPAGPQTLHGEQALGFVRARKTLGNGSDTARMERQQRFLGALVKKVQSNGVLLNPTRLYPVLDAATKSITTDPGLDSLRDLYDLTRSIRSIPTEKVQFLTVPRQPHSSNPNRDELVQPEAGQLFKSLREDAPVTVVPTDEEATGKPEAEGTTGPSPTPTFPGTNAAEGMCE